MLVKDIERLPRAVQIEFIDEETGESYALLINSGPMWFRWDPENNCYRGIQEEKTAKLWRKLKKAHF